MSQYLCLKIFDCCNKSKIAIISVILATKQFQIHLRNSGFKKIQGHCNQLQWVHNWRMCSRYKKRKSSCKCGKWIDYSPKSIQWIEASSRIFYNSYVITPRFKKEVASCVSRKWSKENHLRPWRESNLWPSMHQWNDLGFLAS